MWLFDCLCIDKYKIRKKTTISEKFMIKLNIFHG